jgi:hypothetical protein
MLVRHKFTNGHLVSDSEYAFQFIHRREDIRWNYLKEIIYASALVIFTHLAFDEFGVQMVKGDLEKFLTYQLVCILFTIPIVVQIMLKRFFNYCYPGHEVKVIDLWGFIDLACFVINLSAYIIVSSHRSNFIFGEGAKSPTMQTIFLSFVMIFVLISGYIKLLFYFLLIDHVGPFLYTVYIIS